MANFHETVMGHRFYEGDVPRAVRALEGLQRAVEQLTRAAENQAQGAPTPRIDSRGDMDLLVWVRKFASLVGEDGLSERSCEEAFALLYDAVCDAEKLKQRRQKEEK